MEYLLEYRIGMFRGNMAPFSVSDGRIHSSETSYVTCGPEHLPVRGGVVARHRRPGFSLPLSCLVVT